MIIWLRSVLPEGKFPLNVLLKVTLSVVDLGFNFSKYSKSATINGTGGLGRGGGAFCAPEANAFRVICSLKPVYNSNIKDS